MSKRDIKLYRARRLGLGGLVGFACGKLFKRPFDSYLYQQKHYYEKLPESAYPGELGLWYKAMTGRTLENIEHPVTFNDKMQWLKLHDNTEVKAICADKYRVRGYIEQAGLPDLKLAPLLGAWDRAEDIDFDALPKAFVLKQNAACHLNLIVKDKSKLDIEKTRATMKTWLEITFGFEGMELQYLKSPKKIIAEAYLEGLDGNLYDYKIYCFNGAPAYVEVIGDRDLVKHTGYEAFFDLDWNIQEFATASYPIYPKPPERPKNLDRMIEIARVLSKPFPFVRVDLYNLDGEIYFGELTFTSTNGIGRWVPQGTNERLGEMLRLPK